MASAPPERYVSLLTRRTLALVLAGGRGTRLGHLTRWRAKPAIHFGGKYRLVDFPLSNCVNSGVRRIGVLTQYKAQSLIRHLQLGWGFMRGQFGEFVEILPAQQRIETSWYAGTADAVFQNLDLIRGHDPDFILVLAGDHVYKMDYGPMIAFHVESGADATIGCVEVPLAAASSLGVVTAGEDGTISGFDEKPADPRPAPGRDDVALASMGIYVFDAEFLYGELEDDAGSDDSSHDFGRDLLPSIVERRKVVAHRFTDPETGAQRYWRDVGTPDALWRANIELLDDDPELDLHDQSWPIWTHQRQLPAAKFVFDEVDRRGVAIDSMVSSGAVVAGSTVRRSLLFPAVRVRPQSSVLESVLFPEVEVGRDCVLRRVMVDRGCHIPDGSEIGEDRAADAERFHVTDGGITVVTPEMLGRDRPKVSRASERPPGEAAY